MSNLHLVDHPLVQHKISLMRDKNTGSKEFRELVSETSMLITYEATRDLPLKVVSIETPIAVAQTKVISGRKLAFVPILRAGAGMVDGAVQLVPAAKIGHIGSFCDPETHEVNEYYCKLPTDIAERDVIITDVMLGTGHTAVAAIKTLKEHGVKNIKFMCIIASKQGVEVLMEAHPEVHIYCGVIDDNLDEKHYISPGLGDAGDRIFGTK